MRQSPATSTVDERGLLPAPGVGRRPAVEQGRGRGVGTAVMQAYFPRTRNLPQQGSYLVDPASSHMLVSKIKPCMSKYKLLYTVKLRMAH